MKKEKKLVNSFQRILIISTILSVVIIFAFRMVWHYSFLKSGLSSTQDSIDRLYKNEVRNYARYNTKFFQEFIDNLHDEIEREIILSGNTLHSAAVSIYRDYNATLPEQEVQKKIEFTLEHMRNLDLLASVTIVDTTGYVHMARGIDGLTGKNLGSYLGAAAKTYMLNEFHQLSNTSLTTYKKDNIYMSKFWSEWLNNYRNFSAEESDSSSTIIGPAVITEDLKSPGNLSRSMFIKYFMDDIDIPNILCMRRFEPYQWGIIYEYKISDRWKAVLEKRKEETYSLINDLYEDVNTVSLFLDEKSGNYVIYSSNANDNQNQGLTEYLIKQLKENPEADSAPEGYIDFTYPHGKRAKNFVCYYMHSDNPQGISATVLEQSYRVMGTDYLKKMYRKQAVVEFFIIVVLLTLLLGIVLFWTVHVRKRLEHYVDYICDAFNSYIPGVTPFEMGEIKYWEWQKVADAANRMLQERNRIEYELENERAFTEQLFSRNINSVVLIKPDGSIIKVNPSFENLFGYKSSEIVGKNIDDLIVPEGMLEEATKFTRDAVTIDNIHFEARRKHSNGKLIDVRVLTTPVIVSDYVVAIYSIYEDISLKKKAEQENIKAREEALAAARAKSSFLATVSHEIRTPLNGIIGMTEVMANTALTNEQQDYLEIVKNSGDTLLVIINDILDLSKMESGNLDIVDKMFDLDRCLTSCLDVVSSDAEHRNIEVLLEMDSSVPQFIYADEFRIRQVLLNLIGNAVKFTENGEVTLKVNVVEETSSVLTLRFEIADTGIGIPEEKLENIFETFTQADSTITRRYGGTGLGLAICRKLIRMLGGEIHVQSKVGSGTSFIFNLALSSWERTTQVFDISRKIIGQKILLVEPNWKAQKLLKKYLESYSLEVTAVSSYDDCINTLRINHKFEYGLINYQIPGHSGVEVAKEIRKFTTADSMKLILMKTTSVQGESLHLFQAILRKPVTLYKLASALIEDTSAKREEKTLISTELYKGFAEEFPLKILLAEDNVVNQKLAYHLLAKLGYTIDIVDNGKKALEYTLKNKYDVILMDLQMPIMDGITASKEIIARIDASTRPYLIALTANSAELNRQECLDVGMDDFISKPFKARELKERFIKVYTEKYM
ncbi:MAG: response regulator [Candidatus Cloacimonetes bacterium]|nr:response regulator [Candidatus Cloacimonadota bacterium]